MRNISSFAIAATVIAGAAWAPEARARQQAQGFAVERLDQSAPGDGWFVMDDLNLYGAFGGAASLTLGYAHAPLRIQSPAGAPGLAVVLHQTFASVALAVSYNRFRLYTNFSSPLYVSGQSGIVGGWQFTGPVANVEQNPDTISDVQVGMDTRIFGEPAGPLRLGANAELIIPSGDRADYLTDNTYRAKVRLLVAGDRGRYSYAGHIGVHIRPLDDASVPGSPRGSELIFGAAAGATIALLGRTVLIGPEVFGATAFRSILASDATALEALLTSSLDAGAVASGRLRIKLGFGAGLHPQFGAPQWRAVLAVELVHLP